MNRILNKILKCMFLLVVLVSISGIASAEAPNITNSAPDSPVSDNAGQSRTFNITADQTVTFTWYINSSLVQENDNVPNASYTNTSAAKGVWNVSAVANNSNGSVMRKWTWNVTTPAPSPGAPNITSFTPASPVSDNAGQSRTFNITVNQTVNVIWYINGSPYHIDSNVLNASYTNLSAAKGIWTVNATATNATTGLSDSQEWTWNVTTPAQGATDLITSSAPASPVSNNAGDSRTFNITANQTVNVTWYINGNWVQLNQSVLNASYTNTSAVNGNWTVNATATNTTTGLSDSQEWIWNVTTSTPTQGSSNLITSSAPASPVSNIDGDSRTFNITANQTVTFTWYINSNLVQENERVMNASYTNTSAIEGVWIVNATATNTTTGLSDSQEWTWKVLVANITGFTLDNNGTRGKWINASVNITNNGSISQWFVIDVSGVNAADGYPLVGTATVRLNAGETLNNIPVLITVPPSASTGTYNLLTGIWKLGDFAIPDKLITIKGPRILTIR